MHVVEPVILREEGSGFGEEGFGALLSVLGIHEVVLHGDGEIEVCVYHLVVATGLGRRDAVFAVEPSRVVANDLFMACGS